MKSALAFVFLVVVMAASKAAAWQDGDGGRVSWDFDCDFAFNDLDKVYDRQGENCGSHCLANTQCTHFTYNGGNGICFLKRVPRGDKNNFYKLYGEKIVCGFVKNRV